MGNFGAWPVYEPVPKDVIDARIKHHMAHLEQKFTYQENKLRDENAYLHKVNANLEKEVQKLKDISDILKNPETNISWLPDVVERRLYKNIAMMLLNVLETTVENSDIKLLGHHIKFVMDPVTPIELPTPSTALDPHSKK
jgi:uncharacterized coiled-coil protein SlyX